MFFDLENCALFYFSFSGEGILPIFYSKEKQKIIKL